MTVGLDIARRRSSYDYLRKLVYESSAIVVGDDKDYLFEARLGRVLRDHGLTSFEELVDSLRDVRAAGLRQTVVEALTTNETSFFRDWHPFQALRDTILPRILEERRFARRLTVWCAAASTGQEPYSVAMLLHDFSAQLSGWMVRVVATDISTAVLERAREGIYSQFDISRGLPATYLARHFERVGQDWRISERIRRMVDFQRMNLIGQWLPLQDVDLVLMRNVLIYFDVETKRRILDRVAQVLRPGGFLLLGGVESTLNITTRFTEFPVAKGAFHRRLPDVE